MVIEWELIDYITGTDYIDYIIIRFCVYQYLDLYLEFLIRFPPLFCSNLIEFRLI